MLFHCIESIDPLGKNQHIDNIDKIFLLILAHGIFFHLVDPRFHLGFEIPDRSIAYILRFVFISPSSPSSPPTP